MSVALRDEFIFEGEDFSSLGKLVPNANPTPVKAVYIPGAMPEPVIDYFLNTKPEEIRSVLREKRGISSSSETATHLSEQCYKLLPDHVLKFLEGVSSHFYDAASAIGAENISFMIIDNLSTDRNDPHTKKFHFESPARESDRSMRLNIAVSNFMPTKEVEFLMTDDMDDNDIRLMNGFSFSVEDSSDREPQMKFKTHIARTQTGDALAFMGLSEEHSDKKTEGLLHRTHPHKAAFNNPSHHRYSFIWHANIPDQVTSTTSKTLEHSAFD